MKMNMEEFSGICSCGKDHEITTNGIWIESGAIGRMHDMMKTGELSQYKNPLIICDENTWKAAASLFEQGDISGGRICLSPEGLHADHRSVELLQEKIPQKINLLIALGAGTIHDLTRYMAKDRGIPFLSVPTAASVDGFVSTVAAMTWHGMKKTIPAVAPIYVFADTKVMAKAPYRLTASGISDLLGKYIALLDWKIAHLVTQEDICKRVCQLEEQALKEVVASIDDLRAGEDAACEKLMSALLLSGIAMQMIGNSRPASCAEHHVSHLWEMEVINKHLDALHGEKVSVGLMLIKAEYERIATKIKDKNYRIVAYEGMELELIEATFGKKKLYQSTIEENTPDPLWEVTIENLEKKVEEIVSLIDELPSALELRDLLKRGGCYHSVEEVGLSEDIIPLTLQMAPYVRNRISFLRLSKLIK